MTDREKLIARLNASFEMQYSKRGMLTAPHTADDLISYGVTFAKDTNVPTNPVIPGHDDQYNIAEMSYNNGYAKGYEDGSKTRKRGIWVAHTKHGFGWYECSECHVCGSPQWKCCPVCEIKMEPIPMDDSCPGVKTITINNIKREVKSYGEEQ